MVSNARAAARGQGGAGARHLPPKDAEPGTILYFVLLMFIMWSPQ